MCKHRRVFGERHRRLVTVANAESTADVDVRERNAARRQRVDQRQHFFHRLAIGREFGDLRSDMEVDAAHRDRWKRSGMAIQRRRVFDVDAKFAFAEPGGDVGMRSGIDVGIHTQADRCDTPHPMRDRCQQRKLRSGFDVEAKYVRRERRLHLRRGLADTRKYDLARIAARRDDTRELTARHNVEAASEPRKNIEHAEVGVRLHRVAHKMR